MTAKRHYGKRKRTHKEQIPFSDIIRQQNYDEALLLYRLESELAALRAEMMIEGYPLGQFNKKAGLLWKPTIRRTNQPLYF